MTRSDDWYPYDFGTPLDDLFSMSTIQLQLAAQVELTEVLEMSLSLVIASVPVALPMVMKVTLSIGAKVPKRKSWWCNSDLKTVMMVWN